METLTKAGKRTDPTVNCYKQNGKKWKASPEVLTNLKSYCTEK